ncbi:hypothetical protein ANCDUO_02650 [Ancylostoma duodenale]|uniref:Uncharacterized protein n=1 Tax=Ancylostoma duodenale TaxID=51022 RepID=A0A0C2DVW7_9BILA|nr:hypothetical protein ANCDUO_02650 [Ancylostoma duodenale]
MFCSDPVVEIYFRNAGKLVDQCQKCMLTSYHGRPWQRRFDSPSATFETHISTISAAISSSLSQQLSYSVVISSSPAREKTVSFKIFCEDVPRFSVTYKDKKDMYECCPIEYLVSGHSRIDQEIVTELAPAHAAAHAHGAAVILIVDPDLTREVVSTPEDTLTDSRMAVTAHSLAIRPILAPEVASTFVDTVTDPRMEARSTLDDSHV